MHIPAHWMLLAAGLALAGGLAWMAAVQFRHLGPPTRWLPVAAFGGAVPLLLVIWFLDAQDRHESALRGVELSRLAFFAGAACHLLHGDEAGAAQWERAGRGDHWLRDPAKAQVVAYWDGNKALLERVRSRGAEVFDELDPSALTAEDRAERLCGDSLAALWAWGYDAGLPHPLGWSVDTHPSVNEGDSN